MMNDGGKVKHADISNDPHQPVSLHLFRNIGLSVTKYFILTLNSKNMDSRGYGTD